MEGYKLLSIDAWRYDDGWTWNNWFDVGRVPEDVVDSYWENHNPRKLLKWFRDEGYLDSVHSQGLVAVDDGDQHNLVLMERGNRRPLYAIELVD